jgi:DNA-binding IclR family transcriptional regulator
VLHVHGLALVVQIAEGSAHLVGSVTDTERRLWELVMRGGGADADGLADAAGLSAETAHELLESLAHRRLVRRDQDSYIPLGTAD